MVEPGTAAYRYPVGGSEKDGVRLFLGLRSRERRDDGQKLQSGKSLVDITFACDNTQ